jgi:hypothetical protein
MSDPGQQPPKNLPLPLTQSQPPIPTPRPAPLQSPFPTKQFLLFIVALLFIAPFAERLFAPPSAQPSAKPAPALQPSASVITRPTPTPGGAARDDILPSRESAKSDQLCREENTKRGELDWRMYDYCMDVENRGYDKLIEITQKYQRIDWFEDVLNYTVKHWTKKGVRSDSMVAYELGRIVDGFEDLQYESKQPSFDQKKYFSCQKQWNLNFEAMNYCYKD